MYHMRPRLCFREHEPLPCSQCHQLKEWIEAIPFALSLSKGLSRGSTGSPRTAYIP
jgi:hypothetical protein